MHLDRMPLDVVRQLAADQPSPTHGRPEDPSPAAECPTSPSDRASGTGQKRVMEKVESKKWKVERQMRQRQRASCRTICRTAHRRRSPWRTMGRRRLQRLTSCGRSMLSALSSFALGSLFFARPRLLLFALSSTPARLDQPPRQLALDQLGVSAARVVELLDQPDRARSEAQPTMS